MECLCFLSQLKSSAHSKYRCQYHIVFAPKYRRQEIYGKIKKDVGEILRKLCNQMSYDIWVNLFVGEKSSESKNIAWEILTVAKYRKPIYTVMPDDRNKLSSALMQDNSFTKEPENIVAIVYASVIFVIKYF